MTDKPLILAVDDDGPILVLMRSLLQEFGFEPVLANNGAQALERARARTPHLVLLDKNMPGMSGRQVVEAMRADTALRDVPVVMLTGEPMSEEELEGMGANGAILKPFDIAALLATIRSHVGVARL